MIRTWDVRHGLGLHALQLAILSRGLELLGYGEQSFACELVVSAA